MTAHVNGVNLYYEERGQGQILIMLHGNGEDHTIFQESAELLSEKYRVILVDSRGYGQSSPVIHYDYREMAGDVCALIRLLQLKNIILYGFSDGGIIALMAAAQEKEIVKLVVSGANLCPMGLSWKAYREIHSEYRRTHDAKCHLMLTQPHITRQELGRITAQTTVLAGEHDLIRRSHTKKIHRLIAGSRMEILPDEDHGSYIVHSQKIAEILMKV